MRYLIWSCLLIFASCKPATQEDETKYNYSDDFKTYFKTVFNQEIKARTEYFIVPLSSCGQCVDSALDHLAHDNLHWVVILSGQTEDSIRLRNIGITKESYICYNDSASMISDYSVSIGLPTLLKTDQEGQIVSKKEYHYGSWQ